MLIDHHLKEKELIMTTQQNFHLQGELPHEFDTALTETSHQQPILITALIIQKMTRTSRYIGTRLQSNT
ncbi:hypothetical protein CLOM_g23850 [Closterium sp. NIES-68]|nr:hypothetical protein CLOM_g23850 [Closterium sp. NIES-68]GJP79753.1 hypothetical protein CLOP_g9949 [Closterium sp. NIES-67]